LVWSIYKRKELRDTTGGDPWNGHTLEWSTSSPPPPYNYAVIPQVHDRDAWWEMKKAGKAQTPAKYHDLELPKNTPFGVYISGFVFLFGVAMTFHAILFALIGLFGAITCAFIRGFDHDSEYILPAVEVEKIEKRLRQK